MVLRGTSRRYAYQAQGQAVVVAYTDPTTGQRLLNAIQGRREQRRRLVHHRLEDGVPEVVNNSTVAPPDTTPPTLVSAEVSRGGNETIVLTFERGRDIAGY